MYKCVNQIQFHLNTDRANVSESLVCSEKCEVIMKTFDSREKIFFLQKCTNMTIQKCYT